MESEGISGLMNSTVLIGLFAGGSIVLLMYILKLMRTEHKNTDIQTKHVKEFEQFNARKDSGQSGKGKKKANDNRWTSRSDKQSYSHPWLLTSLKGHTGQVLDMDFSSNGKYLASCGDEEPDPGGDLATGTGSSSSSSSSSECNKENGEPSSGEPSPRAKPLSRRQRKNRRRDEGSSPESKKKAKSKRSPEVVSKRPPPEEPLVNYEKIGIPERDLHRFFHSYLLSAEQMLALGYPVESSLHPGRAIIFKSPVEVPSYSKSNYRHNKPEVPCTGTNVNAREFVPLCRPVGENDSSGHGSGSSSDSGENLEDSEESGSDNLERVAVVASKPEPPRTYQQVLVNHKNVRPTFYFIERPTHSYLYPNPIYERTESVVLTRPHVVDPRRKVCVRCSTLFFINGNSSYHTLEPCSYHWGRLQKTLGPNEYGKSLAYSIHSEYSCCRGKANSRGCTRGNCHVWNGLVPGFNGPFDGYVRTRPRRSLPPDGNFGVYALDCEMCYTGSGLELVKITVVGVDGHLVYDTFVRTEHEIVDYNTRFSGITSKDMNRKKNVLKSLREVQNDLMGFINANTLLIGHGLENDLRALRIIHSSVIDTAVAFPHFNGLPYRRSLKSLTSCFLKREIQNGSNGHNSYEDARACMDLMLWRIRKDFRSIIDHAYSC